MTLTSIENDDVEVIDFNLFVNDVRDNDTDITIVSNASGDISQYNATIDDAGYPVKMQDSIDMMPQVRPELPINMAYPDVAVRKGDVWGNSSKMVGTYVDVNNNLNTYVLDYSSNYRYVNDETIEVDHSNYTCVGIEVETRYQINLVTNSSSGNEYTNITGHLTGVDWVDTTSGLLIQWNFNKTGEVISDSSEIYRSRGLFNSYKTISTINSYIEGRLTGVKNGD